MTSKLDKRSGSVLVLAVLFCVVLIPMVGLAIDGTDVYMMRNQITNALDAAVLAGNRSLSLGTDIATQEASAQTVAMNTFEANVAGMSSNLQMSVQQFSATQDQNSKMITVSGSVTATLPLMLMGLMIPAAHWPTFTVSASAARRSVNVMLVLDHSAGMTATAFNANPIGAIQADATLFVNMFINGTDNIGLVGFVGAPYLAAGLPNQNFQSNLPNDINSLLAVATGASNTAGALSVAYQQLQSLNQPGSLNVIVLFTDGLASAFTGNYAGLVTSSTYGGCNTSATPLYGLIYTDPYGVNKYGLSDITATSINDSPESRAAPSCTSTTNYPQRFLSSMPSVDYYGNSTNGSGTIGEYAPVTLTSLSGSNITYAAENALDDAANRIRSNSTLPATIFVIGLSGNQDNPPDPVLMPRIANDPSSAYYDGSQPAGQYINAPTTGQLQSAFASIASQVLKLAAR